MKTHFFGLVSLNSIFTCSLNICLGKFIDYFYFHLMEKNMESFFLYYLCISLSHEKCHVLYCLLKKPKIYFANICFFSNVIFVVTIRYSGLFLFSWLVLFNLLKFVFLANTTYFIWQYKLFHPVLYSLSGKMSLSTFMTQTAPFQKKKTKYNL